MTSPTATTDRAKARWNPSRFIWIAAAVIAVVTLGTLLLSSPRVSPGGLGIYATETIKEERDNNKRVTKYLIEKSDGKTVWDWLELIGVPVTLAVLGISFQVLEQRRASWESKRQQELVAEENKEETLQRYFDRVAQLLIEKDLIGISLASVESNSIVESSSDVIRARSLSVLRSFSEDGERKASVVLFLYETEILKTLKVSLRGADLRGANLTEADLADANLADADLTKVDLRGANLFGANLRGANLSRANLRGAYLIDANLRGAYLIDADLTEAVVTVADFNRRHLSLFNLGDTFLPIALFNGDPSDVISISTNLSSANLSGANLSSANLRGADLSGADLSNTNLRGADLSGANLSEVRWTKETQWPDKAGFKGARSIHPELKKQLGLD